MIAKIKENFSPNVPLDDFFRKDKIKNRYLGHCKKCEYKSNKEYKLRHPEQLRKASGYGKLRYKKLGESGDLISILKLKWRAAYSKSFLILEILLQLLAHKIKALGLIWRTLFWNFKLLKIN